MKAERINQSYSQIGTQYDPRIGSCPWFWMWFFGPLYLIYKGLVGHAIIWLLLCWTVIVPLVYIIQARSLVYNRMERKGLLR